MGKLIRQYLLSKKYLWTMESKKDCSWVIKGPLKHRKEAPKIIRYTVTNGRDTYLWHDLWCDSSPLLEDEMVRQQLNLPLDTKVSSLIDGDKWNNLVTHLPDSDLRSNILAFDIASSMEKDEIVWTLTASGRFSSKSTYECVSRIWNKVRWSEVV